MSTELDELSYCWQANANLSQRNEELEQKVRDHRSFWIMAATIVPSVILILFSSIPKRDVFEGANRCQTLRWMARAARSNLSHETDEKAIAAMSSVEAALAECSPYDFGDDPPQEE
ncbi:hypothetical protein [Bradyrhizobium monzae]|uniref:hypothetical protein n=1 Tax=Bradyrhizobium sp. Oc8 TaxID=2876780 RepID=UPI001F284985|nr:hypothetical protein [Bradyrhizobium sp. Oc8]